MAIIAPDVAIDLGTANTRIYVRHKGIVLDAPTLMAFKGGKKRTPVAIGEDARLLLGRTKGDLTTVQPLKNGLIDDYDTAEYLLEYLMRKAIGSSRLVRPRGFITVPSNLSAVDRKVITGAATSAGIRKGALHLIEKPFAAALGTGLPVFDPIGSMVVDIGGGTTEAAVISLGGIVISRSIPVGGDAMNEAIINYCNREHNIQIGPAVAEKIKLDLGSALPSGDKRSVFVRSGDSLSRLSYQNVEITTDAVYEALKEPCQQILAAAQYVLERTPPELAGDVMRSGIHLTGGGALLYGMERFFATELDMPVLLAKEPLACSVLGIGHLSENIDLLQSMITSQSVRIG